MTDSVTPSAEQQLQAARESFYKQSLVEYRKLIAYIKSLPIKQECFNEAVRFLDTGILWVKEAVLYGEFIALNPPAAEVMGEEVADVPDQVRELTPKQAAELGDTINNWLDEQPDAEETIETESGNGEVDDNGVSDSTSSVEDKVSEHKN